MPAKRKASVKKETAEMTRRSTRNASAPSGATSGTKRKASPSPAPTKRTVSAKKGRTKSPSPPPDSRRASRGRKPAVKKEEPKPAAKSPARSASQRGRVTRNIVNEVDAKKKVTETKTETKSRSLSRAAKAPAPAKQVESPKSKPSTPKQKVETPKQRAETSKQEVETPKQKAATPRGRSTTPRQQKESPVKVATPKKMATPKTPKPTPKTTPKQVTSAKKQRASPPAKKTPTPKTDTKKKAEPPTRTSRSRRSRATDEEVEDKTEKQESRDVGKEENAMEESPIPNEQEEGPEEATEGEVRETESESVEEEIKADIDTKDAEAIQQTTKESENVDDVNEPVAEEVNSKDKEERMETDENEAGADTEISKTNDSGKKSDESVEIPLEEADDTDSTMCQENDIDSEVIKSVENKQPESETKTSGIEEIASETVEVIGDTLLKPTADVIELKDDEAENSVEQTEGPAVINDSNVQETVDGSGDQIVKNSKNVESGTELSNDVMVINEDDASKNNDVENDEPINFDNDIEEIDLTESGVIDLNEVEEISLIQGAGNNINQGESEINDIDVSKRKLEDIDQDEATVKKPRVADEVIKENGDTVEDVVKDFVVVEMGDVPQPESSEVLSSLPNPVFSRPFIPNPAYTGSTDSAKRFSIASYNMLADCHLFRNDYSFTDPKYLQSEYRLNKVIEELKYLNADVLCMQEVDPDYYTNQLLPALNSLGYAGLFKKRKDEWYKEGEATFYKTNRFTLLKSKEVFLSDLVEKELTGIDPVIQEAVRSYMNLPDVVIITKLRCNNTGQEVTVGNVHIQWGEMKVPDAQCVQIASAVKEIVANAEGDVFPHIICGDFNSAPMSPGYLVARDGYPSGDETINKLMQINNLDLPDGKKASLVNSLWPAFQHTSSSLRSAYSEAQGYEPEVSSFNCVMCDCVDYIFYSSSSLDNVGVLQMAPKEKIMETGGIPNCYFPSDHVSIKAVLSFK